MTHSQFTSKFKHSTQYVGSQSHSLSEWPIRLSQHEQRIILGFPDFDRVITGRYRPASPFDESPALTVELQARSFFNPKFSSIYGWHGQAKDAVHYPRFGAFWHGLPGYPCHSVPFAGIAWNTSHSSQSALKAQLQASVALTSRPMQRTR